jgi:hypothetical protein
LGLRGGLRPCAGVFFWFARIIYALITVINNSGGVKNRVGGGGEAPQAKPQNERLREWRGGVSVAGGATPSATPLLNARKPHNRHYLP